MKRKRKEKELKSRKLKRVLARGCRGTMVGKRIVWSLGEMVVSMEGTLALG